MTKTTDETGSRGVGNCALRKLVCHGGPTKTHLPQPGGVSRDAAFQCAPPFETGRRQVNAIVDRSATVESR